MRFLLILIALAAAAALLAPIAGRAELPPIGPYPDRPCNLAARMNIYIAPDGTLWECMCEALTSGHVCDWYDQGKVSARKSRRHKLRIMRVTLRPVIA